ncbi:MAG: extracellular solute-binding protein family 3 [Ramlibacter sp.]|nr:extracellular solute-binding protein family 3 [Ramlibacter sp.]
MRAAALVLVAAAAGAQTATPAAQPPQATTLRVCADPDNLPYSREDGSGFENRIARLVADDLGLQLEYAWLPDRRGFVRKTMGSGLCDLIIGVPVEFERTLNTRPYYRSSYVLVESAALGAPPAGFDDPRLRQWRIGVQLMGDDFATTPPGYALAQAGAVDNIVGFPLPGEEPAAARMVQALDRGELDAAFLWGPQAGYYAQRAARPLQLHYVPPPPTLAQQPFSFDIAMGVRRGDTALRDRLNDLMTRRQADIDRILAEYGVPRVQEKAP